MTYLDFSRPASNWDGDTFEEENENGQPKEILFVTDQLRAQLSEKANWKERMEIEFTMRDHTSIKMTVDECRRVAKAAVDFLEYFRVV